MLLNLLQRNVGLEKIYLRGFSILNFVAANWDTLLEGDFGTVVNSFLVFKWLVNIDARHLQLTGFLELSEATGFS